MDRADLVALIALLVSLIALLIALIQLLQSSALTAEGWRQCNATNIGRWSVFSRRKWLWSELRCEVKYTTPTLKLIDTSELFRGEGSTLATVDYVKDNFKERVGQWVFNGNSEFNRSESKVARSASHILGFGTLPCDIEQTWQASRSSTKNRMTRGSFSGAQPSLLNQLLVGCWRWFRGYHFRHTPNQPFASDRENSSVTWDTLIREVYKLQHDTMCDRKEIAASLEWSDLPHVLGLQNPPPDPNQKTEGNGRETLPNGKTPGFDQKAKGDKRELLRNAETLLCVDLQRRSWDFIPPDVVRPLAQATLHTIVVLARRLGLEWKTFDLSTETFRAEGVCGTLSSIRVRGIGHCFRFDINTGLQDRALLATANADMAYFGILPGEGKLGVPDYWLVEDDRKYNNDKFFRGELGEEAMKLRRQLLFWSRVVVNDAPALLCPFMPLDHSSVPNILTALGTQNRLEIWVKVSLFRVFGLDSIQRDKLNTQLEKICPPDRVLSFSKEHCENSVIDKSLKDLFALHRESKRRVLQTDNKPVMEGVAIPPAPAAQNGQFKAGCAVVDALRDVHTTTTDYFKDLGNGKGAGSLKDVGVDYNHIVKAHMALVSYCVLECVEASDPEFSRKLNAKSNKKDEKQLDDKKNKSKNEKHEKPKHDKMHNDKADNLWWDHSRGDLSNGWNLLLEICDMLPKELDVFCYKLKKQSTAYEQLSDEQMHDIWWMLVARGVAWQLSVNIGRSDYRNLVPSSVYQSKMLVWIE